MIWLAALSGAAAAVRLTLTAAPRPTNTVELAAAGWTPRALRVAIGVLTAGAALAVFAAVATVSSARSGGLAAVTAAMWVPVVAPPGLRLVILTGYRVRRDTALLEWLRRVRLYCASGSPINDAAVTAAERVTSPAFAPAATSINLALAAGHDPLTAAAPHFAGSVAETLVGTLAQAERSGAAATDLIDRLITQAVQTLEDGRRDRIESVTRSISNTVTLMAIVASAVVVTALLAGIQTGI